MYNRKKKEEILQIEDLIGNLVGHRFSLFKILIINLLMLCQVITKPVKELMTKANGLFLSFSHLSLRGPKLKHIYNQLITDY